MPDRRLTARQKRAVAERAGRHCEYCLTPAAYSSDPFSTEHIHPRASGGSHDPSNLAYSCLGCNNFKYTHTEGADPTTGVTVALYHPRRDRWRDHFAWNEDFTQVVGLTATGRATVDRLQLNRPGVINLRRALRLAGVHTPSEMTEPA